MPELPEVETVKRGLSVLLGEDAKLKSVELIRKDLRFPVPSEISEIFKNQKLLSLKRRAKYLIFEFKKGFLFSHLGMTGTWREITSKKDLIKHDHLVFHFKNKKIVFNDPRRFGYLDYCLPEEFSSYHRFGHLGPEPLDKKGFSDSYLWEKSRKRVGPIKNFIMDQKIVVGVGNIYAAEALFLSGIRPTRKTGKITRSETETLVENIRLVLDAAIGAGGSTISDFKQAGGESGYFQNSFNVYGKEGEACPICSNLIKNITLGGRSSFYCSKCQK